MFKRLTETEERKKELDENFWYSEYLSGPEARKQMDHDDAQLRTFLKKLAPIK